MARNKKNDKKSKMVKVIIKLLDSCAVSVRRSGMHLGMMFVEQRPKVFELDANDKEQVALFESKQFEAYMEVIEADNINDLEVGSYVDALMGAEAAEVDDIDEPDEVDEIVEEEVVD